MQTETQRCFSLAGHPPSPAGLGLNVRVPGRDPDTFFTLPTPIFAPKFPVSLCLWTRSAHKAQRSRPVRRTHQSPKRRLMSPARRRCASARHGLRHSLHRAPERARPGLGSAGQPGPARHSRGERDLRPAPPLPAGPCRLRAPAAGSGGHAGPAAPPAALGHGGLRDKARHDPVPPPLR